MMEEHHGKSIVKTQRRPFLEDLNQQALQWSTVRLENRAQGKAGLIPAKAFEYERHYLTQLPSHLPAPYRTIERGTDQYGYMAFGGNYYYVPGSRRDDIKVLVYSDRLKLYQSLECLIEYPLPPDAVKNKLFSPKGQPKPRYGPAIGKSPHNKKKNGCVVCPNRSIPIWTSPYNLRGLPVINSSGSSIV